jgi:hypothetical protein
MDEGEKKIPPSTLFKQLVKNMMSSIENSDLDDFDYPFYMDKEQFRMFLLLAAQEGRKLEISQKTIDNINKAIQFDSKPTGKHPSMDYLCSLLVSDEPSPLVTAKN